MKLIYRAVCFWRLLPVALVSLGLTCATAADNKKRAPARKPAKAAAKTSAPARQPSMTIERDAQSGGLVSGGASAPDSLVTGQAPAPVVTQTQLPNGLVMATSSEGFMTTMTVTRNSDGALSYDCKNGSHPKGPHSHGTNAKGQKNEAGER
jgi:hypothetical protein